MFLETIINETSKYGCANHLYLIFKREVPLKIYEVNQKDVMAKLNQKAYTDYYGCYCGKMFDFEAKQTQEKSFNLNNLKQHQLEHLKTVKQFNVCAFLLLHFVQDEIFFAIDVNKIVDLIEIEHIKSIDVEWCKNNAFQIQVVFPGILDLLSFFEKVLK